MEKIQVVSKDLKSPVLEVDFFEYKNKDNYECFFRLINGKAGNAFKSNGILDITWINALETN